MVVTYQDQKECLPSQLILAVDTAMVLASADSLQCFAILVSSLEIEDGSKHGEVN